MDQFDPLGHSNEQHGPCPPLFANYCDQRAAVPLLNGRRAHGDPQTARLPFPCLRP